jgi:hypothetical protein
MENKNSEYLVDVLNKIWNLLETKPTYGEFNKILKVKNEIRKLEEKDNFIGIANFDTENEGVTTISLLSSIVNYYDERYRLAVVVALDDDIKKEDKLIEGFKLVKI